MEDTEFVPILRVHSGGCNPLDISNSSSLSKLSFNEFASVNDLMMSTCFSNAAMFGTMSSAWHKDPVCVDTIY